MLRAWIYKRLFDGRSGALVSGRVFSAGAVPLDVEKPFIVIRAGLREPSVKSDNPTKVQNIVVYAHNVPNDTVMIDDMIEAIHFDLGGSAPDRTAEGVVSACEWLDDSEDLADDHYDTTARNSSWRLVARSR